MRSHPDAVDGALGLILVTIGILGLFGSYEISRTVRPADLLGVLLVVAATAPVAVRRRWPGPALLAGLSGTVVFDLFAYFSPGVSVALLVLVYTVATHLRLRPAALLASLTAIAMIFIASVASPGAGTLTDYVGSILTIAVAYSFGRNVRTRRAYTAALEDRAAHAEAEREAMTERAVADERRRLARELHDVVAHHVSVMGVLAAGARRSLGRADAAERAEDTLNTIENTARTTLRELRRLLDVLREDEEEPSGKPPAPQPCLETLSALVQQVREAGLPVEVTVEGAAVPLPPGVDLSAYRIVQEALTNSLRHGGPSRANVYVSYVPIMNSSCRLTTTAGG